MRGLHGTKTDHVPGHQQPYRPRIQRMYATGHSFRYRASCCAATSSEECRVPLTATAGGDTPVAESATCCVLQSLTDGREGEIAELSDELIKKHLTV